MRFLLHRSQGESSLRNQLEVSAVEYEPVNTIDRHKKIVVAHIHYFDVWSDVELAIKNIDPDEIYITTTTFQSNLDLMKTTFPSATIIKLPNMGRDIYPVIHLANLGVFDKKSVVWKLHTKKSIHTFGGDKWRRDLFFSISGTPNIAFAVHQLLNGNEVSMVGSDRYLTRLSYSNLQDNKILFDLWSIRSGYLGLSEKTTYIAGTIFACKSEVLRDLKYLNLTADNFLVEDNSKRLFSQRFATKLLILQYLKFLPRARSIHARLDLQTRPASDETYAMEAYLGYLAENYGRVVGTQEGLAGSMSTH
jgi:lipopolysaccharide biosynthesis protein